MELRFYDETFLFLRYKVFVSKIKRLRFYDIKFPFLYRNAY
jgi:hypothetical protein